MKNFINEFKKFIDRGNVMDMAVGVVIGGAFTTIVSSLVNDILTPLIAMLTGGTNDSLNWLAINLPHGAVLNLGSFIQNIINFLIIAFAVFSITKAFNRFKKKEEEAPVADPEELILLRSINEELKELNKK